MSSEIAIKIDNLSKCYQIYDKPPDRLKQSIYPRLYRLIGKTPKAYYREFWALRDISFELNKGETVGIIGRNGAGKSTLLQLICGTLTPTAGNIRVNGRIAAMLELGSGFNPEFTGRENVRMNCTLLGLSPKEIDERFDDIVNFAEIGDFIEQPVKTYSSGMFVRLAFAVNIISHPEIMIVDEALAVGDINFKAKCMSALKRIQQNGATVLFVSHDITSVRNLCSRAIYLDHGKVISAGPASEVADQYIRIMRDELNKSIKSQSVSFESKTGKPFSFDEDSNIKFKTSEDFSAQSALFRCGTGEAKINFGELLDENENPINYVEYNQNVLIRIYFTSHSNIRISPGYYIQDDKKNSILGASWVGVLEQEMIESKDGDSFVVTFKTKLPLQDGNYSIQLELVQPVVIDETTTFLDVIDNAIVFKVGPRMPIKIWSKVYVPDSVKASVFSISNK